MWLGSELPARYNTFIDSWKTQHPSWQVRLWTDADAGSLAFLNIEQFDRAPNFGAKSDILRYAILYEFGGIYADTDFLCLRPLDKLAEQFSFVAGRISVEGDDLNNALIGAAPKHPVLAKVLAAIKVDDWSSGSRSTFENTGPALLSKIAIQEYARNPEGLGLLSFDYFYSLPNTFSRVKGEVPWKDYLTENSYAVHFWDTSWLKTPWPRRLRAFLLKPFPAEFKALVKSALKKMFGGRQR